MAGEESVRSPQRRHWKTSSLAISITVVASILSFYPGIIERNATATPLFSRPNALVDKGGGWVESSAYGGPAIAVSSNRTIHAAWSDDRTGTQAIYHSMSYDHGLTWVNEKGVGGSVGFNNIAPSIAVDTSGGPHHGAVYAVWQRGDLVQGDIYFVSSIDGGINWGAPRKVDSSSTSSPSVYPRIAVDSNGFLYVVFMDRRLGGWDIYMTKSADGGATWSTDFRPFDNPVWDGNPSIAAYGGMVVLTWEEAVISGTGVRVAVSTDNGATWTVNQLYPPTSGGRNSQSVSVDIDSQGTIHMAWVMVDSSGDQSIMYSRSTDRGNTWSTFTQVDDAPVNPLILADSVSIAEVSGTLYVVWADNRNGDYDIFASWSEDDGRTWGDGLSNNDDLRVDDTDENAFSGDDASYQLSPLATKGAHGLYVIWTDGRDGSAARAYFASYEVGGILITEVRDSPVGSEDVEIFNPGSLSIDLVGWRIVIGGTPYPLDALGLMPSMTYRTIGDDPLADISVDIDLGDEGDIVRIVDSLGGTQDRVGYGQMGRGPDPLDGESISRVFLGGAYTDAWTRTSVPTFGSQNAGKMPLLNSSLVLNEALFNAINVNNHFIEIYYKGNSSVNLTGYSLVGDVAYALPPVTLTAGEEYHAIRSSAAPPLFALMDASGDNLYLYDPSGSLVDMVGWSSSHMQDRSMSRVPDGFGTPYGYDDVSSIAAGWVFDQVPTLALVRIGPDQSELGDIGARVQYGLTVTNKGTTADYINIEAVLGVQGWNVALLQSDGVTLLADSPGDADSIPDVGSVPVRSSTAFVVAVDIPSAYPPSDSEVSRVRATLASDPIVSATAALRTVLFPYESPGASAIPSRIFVDTSPPEFQPQESTIRLNVTGRGSSIRSRVFQDTMLLIDSSGSMSTNDPANLRLEAAKHYVDLFEVPDRAAVIDFDQIAVLVRGDHLSSNYPRIKSNIDTIDSFGATNLYDPIRIATDELVAYGDAAHKWIQILLTDGEDTTGHSDALIMSEAYRAALYGIQIFTIGLSSTVAEPLLMQIASVTGGIYLKAEKPEDLEVIYQTIGGITKSVAGYDDDLTDDIPMINVFVPSYLQYIPGSSMPPVAYVGTYLGVTNLQWNLSQLLINETWTASFRIKSDITGFQLRALEYPASKVTYIRYDGIRVNVPFPEVFVDVLPQPEDPDLTVTPEDLFFPVLPPYFLGDSIPVRATIRNIGGNASTATSARFYDGMPPAPQVDVDRSLNAILPGGSETVSVIWKPSSPGHHDICVVADPDDVVFESNESNNIACVSAFFHPVPPTKPDYIPHSPDPTSRTTVGLSLPVYLSVAVSNVGNASAANASVIAWSNETGLPFKIATVAPLATSTNSPRFTAVWLSPAVAGTYRVRARVDFYNNVPEWDESNNDYIWTIDVIPGPLTRLVIGTPNYTASRTYITSLTYLSFEVTDNAKSGIKCTMYRVDSSAWTNYTSSGAFHLNGEGLHQIQWYSEDYAGNKEAISSSSLVVDDTPPTTSISIGSPKYFVGGNFVTSHTRISLESIDGGVDPVGIDNVEYRTWNGDWSGWSRYHVDFRFGGKDGTRYIEYRSGDLLGNTEQVVNLSLIVDNTPPETTIEPQASKVSVDTWFDLKADDGKGSGVNSVWKSVNQGNMTRHSHPFTLSKGFHKLVYKAVDNLGNSGVSARDVEVTIGNTDSFVVEFNYKPAVAFVFSVVLFLAAAFSAMKKPLRGWDGPRKRFLVSWSLLMMPFIVFEALTGVLSVSLEPLRIPPLVGWGTFVDLCALVVGCVFLVMRAFINLHEKENEADEAEDGDGEGTRPAAEKSRSVQSGKTK